LFLSSADTGLPSPLQSANLRFIQRAGTLHDAIRWAPTHLLKAYSSNVLEDRICDVRLAHVLGNSHVRLSKKLSRRCEGPVAHL
jgi:hypothetical protein